MGRRVGMAAFAGLLYGACFPPFRLWPLAFVAMAPLVAAARGAGLRRGAVLGWVAGTVATGVGTTPALAVGARAYFSQGSLGAWGTATLLGQLYLALPAAVFGATIARFSTLRAVPVRILCTAAAWAGLEFVRAQALGAAASPWGLLAHALYRAPLWIQTADFGGTYAVSFVLVATAAAAAELRHAQRAALATAAAVLGFAATYGAYRLRTEPPFGPSLRVVLVQGNLPNAMRADPARAGDALEVLLDVTAPALKAHPDLVVWSENAVGLLPESNAWIAARLRETIGAGGPPLLVGAPRASQDAPGRVRIFNSAFLFSGAGETLAVYDKRRLVPFAEYTPGRGAPGDYSPGATPTIFATPAPFGVLICFEGMYGDLARDLVRRGATFLVSVSNDAWFDGSVGAEQAFAMTAFRAVENRRALVRVANTGVSGVFDPSGELWAQLGAGVRGASEVRVPIRTDAGSPYDRVGDAFAWLALAVALAAWVRAR